MSIGVRLGRVPERVTAYLRPEQEILGVGRPKTIYSFPIHQRETAGFAKIKASPAFVVPADSEAFNKSGLKWAMEGRTKPSQGVNRIEVENKPFTNLRWVGIDSRMEGGVAYKVVTEQGWIVDLREDVVLECLFEGLIQDLNNPPQGAGTYFTGEFVWVVMGSQSRIVRVGSDTHLEILEAQKLKETESIPEKDLTVGKVYKDRKGREIALLGRGDKKGSKFLTMEYYQYGHGGTIQQQLDGGIGILGTKNAWPCWHLSGAMTVVQEIGTVKVPDDLMERYLKEVEKNRTWNRV